MKLLSFGLSTNWERELLRADMARELGAELAARLDPSYPVGHPVITTPGHAWDGDGLAVAEQIDPRYARLLGLAVEASGSNNWAVSGERSATGTPLIAGDPHLPPSMPGIWYQVDLELDGRFARGASLPGVPGINMGQTNDVAWTFTNAMADVEDLYVERIEGDRYEFDGEWLPVEAVTEEIEVKGRPEPERLEVRSTHHGPIVNDCLGADDSEPLALRWTVARPARRSRAQQVACSSRQRRRSSRSCSRRTPPPVSNLVWADRHGAHRLPTVGRIPIRRGDCPDLPKPGWTDEYEWEGYVPYEELPEARDPECGYLVTANNRIEPSDYPHHITSEYLDGYRARRIERADPRRPPSTTSTASRQMQIDDFSIPGLETVHRLARLHAARPARGRGDRAAQELGRAHRPRHRSAATIYQAFTIRLAREFARLAIRDRDLAERWLDRSHSGFTNHVTSPWRWQTHLLRLWEEGDDELIGRPWDELALDCLRGALDDLADRFGPDPDGLALGPHPPARLPARARRGANPLFDHIFNRSLEAGGGQETVSQIALDPNEPYKAVWAPSWRMVVDPADPRADALAAVHRPVGPARKPALRRPPGGAGWRGDMQPMTGEGPWRELVLEPMSRRDQIKLTDDRAARAARVRADRHRREPAARAAGPT